MTLEALSPDLITDWSLFFDELELIETKRMAVRPQFAFLLRYRRLHGVFPKSMADAPTGVPGYLAEQVGGSAADLAQSDLSARSYRRHREDILQFLGIRRLSKSDIENASIWVMRELCPLGLSSSAMAEQTAAWFAEQQVVRPDDSALAWLVERAQRRFEQAILDRISKALTPGQRDAIDRSLVDEDQVTGFTGLKADPGQPNLENILVAAQRLTFIRSIGPAASGVPEFSSAVGRAFRRRVSNESPWRMRQHPVDRRHALYSIFLAYREREITDGLIDLLIEIVHKIAVQSKRSVIRSLTKEIERVHGKERLLVRIAEAAVEQPDETVRDVVFAAVGEDVLTAVIKEYRAAGTFERRVHSVLRASYAGHYRRMLTTVLTALDFRSNNKAHRPILEALNWLQRLHDLGRRVIRQDDSVPIEGVIPAKWRGLVLENDKDGAPKINCINYEICVLTALRDRLRCKEIWVAGAYRYRNPDQDLPQDFEERRALYYSELGRDQDAKAFVTDLKAKMTCALRQLNAAIVSNPKVRILWKGASRISISPFDPVPAAPNLDAIKAELERRWPMTELIDILSEAGLQTGFLDEFSTSGDRVILDSATLQKRLLLCLYGLGTNAGLKRVAAGTEGVSYPELLHVRRLFINKEALRAATARVTDAILVARNPAVWGPTGTACASDSKKFGAWDQNLMTEWHVRYNGRGVMIYWHVERQSACIYSQLKRCSSSEVASMIEGVLRHDTDLEIDRQYVDSHGQSEVAFAFCHLLGFDLLPRLKAIARQKLYVPEAGFRSELGNLAPILTRTIDWSLIERNYDEMIKYTAGLRRRTAEPEAILRRFAGSTVKHPTYAALSELGKVVKTLFLCRYIGSEELRREIHEGLNVVENWNSANGFIFFGKGGEFASNRMEDQELSVLALHLLQNCLVYVNTLMLQKILAEPSWLNRMTADDHRGLTPALYSHVNPYGKLDPDLSRRIDFDRRMAA